MFKLLLTALGLTLLGSGAAVAAGAPAFDWNGFYLGINGGVGSSSVGFVTDSGIIDLDGISRDFSASGGLIGGTAGVNIQTGGLLFGIEADLDIANLSGEADPIKPNNSPASILTTNIDWLATLRGRLGWVNDNLLLYATAGLAGGGISGSITNFPSGNTVTTTGGTQYGYVVGAGVEAGLTDHLTAKVEYLYTDLGTSDYDLPLLTAHVHVTSNVIRAGLNYKF